MRRVYATCRNPDAADGLQAAARACGGRLRVFAGDITDEASLAALRDQIGAETDRLHLLVNASGILHDGAGLGPERRIEQVEMSNLQAVFAVNAFGPVLVSKYLSSFFEHRERAVQVHLSARVGSIGDNKLGGWYAYRASKAALNQFVRCLAVELKRKNKQSICVALHPGTVDTRLTKPFQRAAKVLFTPEDAVKRMMSVIDGLTAADSGRFFAYDGTAIEW